MTNNPTIRRSRLVARTPSSRATPCRSATCRCRRVLLINDANYPWLLLVPRRPGAVEIIDLDDAEQVATDDRDRAGLARDEGDDRLRQDQRRGARQRGAAAPRPCHRARAARRRLAEAGVGRGAARWTTANSSCVPAWPTCASGWNCLRSSSRAANHRAIAPPQLRAQNRTAREAAEVRLPVPPRFDLGPKPHLGYTESLIERAAEKRLDAAWLAAQGADRGSRAYVIGGELIVLKKGGALHDPLFTPDEARALGPLTETVFLGLLDGAAALRRRHRAGARRSAEGARRPVRDRPALDRHPGPGRRRASAAARRGQGDAALARAAPLLLQLRRGDRHGRCRLEARLPGLQGRAFPAHRSGRHHAGGARRQGPARPLRPLRRHHVVVPRRLRRARRSDRGRGAARDAWRKPASTAAACKYLFTQPWPFPMSLMIGCHAEALNDDLTIDTNELVGRALVQQGRVRRDADAQASGRPDRAAACRHRPPHHPRLGGERQCPLLARPHRALRRHRGAGSPVPGRRVSAARRQDDDPRFHGGAPAAAPSTPRSRWRGSAARALQRAARRRDRQCQQSADRGDARAKASTSPASCASPGAAIPVSGIMIDATGERIIVTYRDHAASKRRSRPTRTQLVAGVSLLLADNRFPDFVRPICEAARRRGIPVVLDADRPTVEDDPLFGIPTHVMFSSECLRATTGEDDLGAALLRMAPRTPCVPRGQRRAESGALHRGRRSSGRCRCSRSRRSTRWRPATSSTPASRSALAEGRDEVDGNAVRRGGGGAEMHAFGGSMGAPARAEVEALLRDA